MLPDVDAVLETLAPIASAPTAPYHEWRALAAIRRELERAGLAVRSDDYGQLFAAVRRGDARPVVLVAHTDHPAFEVVSADGATGSVRVLGTFPGRPFERPVKVRVYDDGGGAPAVGVLKGFVARPDAVHNSLGRLRIRAERSLEPGQWAVLDLPAFEAHGDELRMAAADDLALCALVVLALDQLSRETSAVDVTAVFTRAEETGLYGARLIAEEGAIPQGAVVVSLEASRALPHAPAGGGPVVRAGDLHNTFSNDAERYLRVAAERLAAEGIPTQRALLTGGTCEASTFVAHGWATTGMALPNVNYHNRGGGERFVPEIVRMDDLRGGVALVVEAVHAAAEDAREAWWPSAGPVPDEVKALLRGREG